MLLNNYDLVKLIFDKHGGGSRLQFRGAVNGITETFSPSWEGIKYNGRADSAFKYSTFERSISFNFKVYPTTKAELKPLYSKLQRLSTMTMPNYGGSAGYEGILLDFTLGELWKNICVLLIHYHTHSQMMFLGILMKAHLWVLMLQ